jgi:hypothetical protein
MNIVSSFVRLVAVASCALLASCASYVTPGKGADFRAMGLTAEQAASMTDSSIASRMSRKPAAGFPAAIAVARVQDRGYYSMTNRGYGNGRYSLVTVRDVETNDQFKQLAALPMVRGIAPLNRLVVSTNVDTLKDLRESAAELQADMLLVYTFDTQFLDDKSLPLIGTITLGLFPNHLQSVATTASAALVDTRTGYIYGLAETTSKKDRVSNYWNSEEAIDKARKSAETESFGKLVNELATTWTGVVAMYGPPAATVPVSAPQ